MGKEQAFFKPVFVKPNIVKGQIHDYDREETYDDDGNKVIKFKLDLGDGSLFTAHVPESAWLGRGTKVVMEINDAQHAVSGINCTSNRWWGKSPRALKKYVEPKDKMLLFDGEVTQKRKKHETQLASDEGAAGVSMELMINEKLHVVPFRFGTKTNKGDRVAVVEYGESGQIIYYRNFNNGRKIPNVPLHYLFWLCLLTTVAGSVYGYQSGRLEWIAAMCTGIGGGLLFWFMAWGTGSQYRLVKHAAAYVEQNQKPQ